MRQDDEIFVTMLNKIRVGEIDQNVEDKLCFIDKNDPCYPGSILHIFAENAPIKRHNDNQLKHIPEQLIIIPAKDEVPKNSKTSDIREAQNRKQSETGGLASLLELKANVRVMLTTNINIEDRLINGQMGTVKHIEIKENEVKTIYLELDEKCAGPIKISGSDVIAKNNKWVPVKREGTSIYLSKYKSTSQFPLVLSWACTAHKVQGLSLTSAVVSFDLEKQKSFNECQMYIALSRVTSIYNLFLIGKYNRNVFKVNEIAVAECNRLRENRFGTINTNYVDCNSLTVSLLNTQSL